MLLASSCHHLLNDRNTKHAEPAFVVTDDGVYESQPITMCKVPLDKLRVALVNDSVDVVVAIKQLPAGSNR